MMQKIRRKTTKRKTKIKTRTRTKRKTIKRKRKRKIKIKKTTTIKKKKNQKIKIKRTIKTKRKTRSEEHTSELQSRFDLVCRLLLEKKKHTQLKTQNTKTQQHNKKKHTLHDAHTN